jgi:hypothetical protein
LCSISLRIYLLSRQNSQNLNYDEQKRGLYHKIYEKLNESWIVKKINQNQFFSDLIAIIKYKGIFHHLVGHFMIVIMLTRFQIIFKYIAYITSIIFFGRLSLRKFIDYEYKVRLRSTGKLNLLPLLGSPWSKFMYNYVYYIFKFLPILIFNCIGLYEIFINYELNYFYKSTWLLLIPFFFNILIRVEGCLAIEWRNRLEETYEIFDLIHAFICGVSDISEDQKKRYYNITSVVFRWPEALDKYEDVIISFLSDYIYNELKEIISSTLYHRFEKNMKFDLFLSILSAIYLGCLLFY